MIYLTYTVSEPSTLPQISPTRISDIILDDIRSFYLVGRSRNRYSLETSKLKEDGETAPGTLTWACPRAGRPLVAGKGRESGGGCRKICTKVKPRQPGGRSRTFRIATLLHILHNTIVHQTPRNLRLYGLPAENGLLILKEAASER